MDGNGFESVKFLRREKTSGGKWILSFIVPAFSSYFKEHFESFRLLPAVGEIDIVARCASEILSKPVSVTAIKKTKFVNPVLPDTEMDLMLDFTVSGVIGFTFLSKKGDKASFGVIYYSI